MRAYAGIGSRCTPSDVLELMERIATALAVHGWTLRSGHADGADQAFERGAMGQADVFLPWESFNRGVPVRGRIHPRPSIDAVRLAIETHPFGRHLREAPLALHGRNSHQVLGPDLDDPSSFVVCWTQNGTLDGSGHGSGGTGQALRLAQINGVQVFNLQRDDHRGLVEDWLGARVAA